MEKVLEKFANIYMSVIAESLLLKLFVVFPENFVSKCVIYILNLLFIDVLTDSFFIYKHNIQSAWI